MSSDILEVVKVKLFPKEDGVDHHTDRFQSNNGACYLRRGQQFHLAVLFSRTFDPRVHRVVLEFSAAGARRMETYSDLLEVRLPEDRQPWPPGAGEWGARRARNTHDTAIPVTVVSPAWLPVGSWQLQVRTELIHSPGSYSTKYTYPGPIYFLFNPWNKNDDSYFRDSKLLEEYILNEVGHVWLDTDYKANTWDYGQFEECVLPAFELAMERHGQLPYHRRGRPAVVARVISHIAHDIVVGRWDDWYADGTPPLNWTGSLEILQKYLDSRGAPVKYGQCWVFAGIVTTICRALGLPARMVTNLASAHDNDESLTIDHIFDNDLELIPHRDEMIWNFHCWVDVWMRRPDLRQPDYDGWQAVDGTPQGPYQCGPAPVRAIHDGDTRANYDVTFVFAEVNGDNIRWREKPDGELQLIDFSENKVGQSLWTDEPNSSHDPRGKNIMDEYKPPEGSIPERLAMWRALRDPELTHARRRRKALDAARFEQDVDFKAQSPYTVEFGDDINLALAMTNKSKHVRTVVTELILDLVDYRNKRSEIIKTFGKLQLRLRPKESETRRMQVFVQDYAPLIKENSFLRYRTKCWVLENDKAWVSEDLQITLLVPRLRMHLKEEPRVGRPVKLYMTFDRAVSVKLTRCRLQLGGSALQRGGDSAYDVRDIEVGRGLDVFAVIVPARAGLQKIIAKFSSAEIPKVEGELQVEVLGEDGAPAHSGRRNFAEHMNEIMSEAFEDNAIH